MSKKAHEDAQKTGTINLIMDPSVTTVFCDNINIGVSKESVNLFFTQKLAGPPPIGADGTPQLNAGKIVSSVEISIPHFLRLASVIDNVATRIKDESNK